MVHRRSETASNAPSISVSRAGRAQARGRLWLPNVGERSNQGADVFVGIFIASVRDLYYNSNVSAILINLRLRRTKQK